MCIRGQHARAGTRTLPSMGSISAECTRPRPDCVRTGARSGYEPIRVQTREDGFSIDQIVLSDTTFVSTSPGALKNDTRILACTN